MTARKGFTLVELLVVMALTMFIMVILSEAFIIATETFRGMKAIGDQQEALRTAVNVLRSDLALDHFEGKRRLSDPDIVTNRPREGFFNITKKFGFTDASGFPSSPPLATGNYVEGNDADGQRSYLTADYSLAYTIRSRGNNPKDFFSCAVPGVVPTSAGGVVPFGSYPMHPYLSPTWDPVTPAPNFGSTFLVDPVMMANNSSGGVLKSQWAEVGLFLEQTGTTEEPGNIAGGGAGRPIYNLVRAQYLMITDPNQQGLVSGLAGAPGSQGTMQDNFPASTIFAAGANLINMAAIQKYPRASAVTANNTVKFITPTDTASGILQTTTVLGNAFGDHHRTRTLGFEVQALNAVQAKPYVFPETILPAGQTNYRHENRQVLLRNVISMNVEVLKDKSATGIFEAPVQNIPTVVAPNYAAQMYDTAPLRFRDISDPLKKFTPAQAIVGGGNHSFQVSYPIHAIKITLRIHDPRTKQTRQVSFVQEM